MKPILHLFFLVVCSFFTPVSGLGQSDRASLQRRLEAGQLSPLEQWETLDQLMELDQKAGWDSMLVYAQRSLEIAEQYLPEKIAASALKVARSLEKKGGYRQMTDLLYYALDHVDRKKSTEVLGQIYGDLGHIFFRQQQYQKCKGYFLRSYAIYEALQDTPNMVIGLTNISSSYDSISADSGLFYLNAALDLALAGDVVAELPKIYNNLGTEIEFGDTPTPEAISYFNQSYHAAVAIQDTAEILIPSVNLGLSFQLLGQHDSAMHYLQLVENAFDKDRDELNLLAFTYLGLAQSYEARNQTRKALEYYKKYTDTNNTVNNQVFSSEINDIEAKYQTEEKEAQLVKKQLELERQTYLRNLILFIGLAIIVLIAGVLVYLRNQQQIRAREAELSLEVERTKAQQLRELDQLKSNFFANISHEFRTPLTLLLGPLEEMQEGTLKGEPQRYYRMMHRNGKRLLDLINQLLDLSKLESGKMELQAEAGNMGRFLQQLAGAMQSWADRKQIDYQIQIANDIPPLLFDRDKIEKIVTNLLANALKYTPENERVEFKVTAKKIAEKIQLTIIVKDTGQGISAEELPSIFGRFYQADQVRDGVASTGIGLALTKELVKLQGGTIEVVSEIGQGSCFTVILPLEISEESVIAPIAGQGPALPETDQVSNPLLPLNYGKSELPLLLIVEDNPDLRTYIRDQLAETYRVIEAENGESGFDQAITRIPDLIITDVMMPKMTGTELTSKLKQDERSSHIPVIMLTAKAEQEDILEGLETGADDYLLKPFNAKELQVRVRNLIEQRERLRAKFSKSALLSPREITVTSVDEQFLSRLLEIIEDQIDNEGFSVEEMGRLVGLSRSQLHRKLKALTDQAPNVFLRTIRLQRAYRLLSQRAGNTSEIAFMTGFSSASYFSKCFKDHFQMTPSEVLQKSDI